MNLANTTVDPTEKNETLANDVIADSFDFKNNPGLVFLTIACGFTGIWILFVTFYNSRLLAFIVTKLLRKFYFKDGHLEIGSLSFSILSGKFMFHDVKYFTKDFSIQIVDGLAIIRWWFLYRPPDYNYYKEVLRDTDKLENGQCRLWVQLNGLECHLYNRSDLYDRILSILKCERYGDARKSTQSLDILEGNKVDLEPNENGGFNIWRELFPAIDFNIRSGKLAVGNQLVERTFWIHFNKAKVTYSMPDAPCTLDHFTHFIHGKCDDVRMLLSTSPGFKGKVSDPPRWRGQDYTVLQSSEVKVTYYMDVPGFVPVESDASPESDPMWGLDIAFTKRAEINYGPWVDTQRDSLQKYFYPNNFQEMTVTKPLEAEQRRLHTGFDVNINFVEGASIELLFTKNEETVAIHIVCGNQNKGGGEKSKPSSIHFHQPWIVNEYGYTMNIVARLHEVEATTSLQFQKFLESDTVEVALNMTLPRIWNHFQHWTCELWLVKTTCYFLWEHVDYISDLLNEWSVNTPADISTFVPYEWEFNFYLRDFELILLVNQFNWVDCTREDENSELALCGETLDINFLLPFTYFQPKKTEMKFFFRGEIMMLRTFIAESNTLRKSIISLVKNSDQNMYPKYNNMNAHQAPETAGRADTEQMDSADGFDELDSGGDGVDLEDQLSKGWRNGTKGSAWIDVWSVPVMMLNLYYNYHPMPVENEMIERINEQCGIEHNAKQPLDLSPDSVTIELEAGPSAIRLLGFFWRQFFLGFKENYFGLFQDLNEFNTNREIVFRKSSTTSTGSTSKMADDPDIDVRKYRPLEVNLTIVLLNLQAELTMHTTGESSPHASAERLTFEMHKTYQETRLQLILSPITIVMQDNIKRSSDNSHLSKGFLTLSGLQFRGDAMFSDKEVKLGNDTIEYAWLVEVQCGELKGKFTPLHVQSLIAFAETFILHITDAENEFLNPDPLIKCQHNVHQQDCKKTLQNSNNLLCPTEEAVKYKMVRVSVERVNLFVAENECVCNIQASPVRLAFCNSRNQDIVEGGSLFINECCIRQYIQQVNLNYVESAKPSYTPSHSNNWVEVGVIGLGPITVDIQSSNCNQLAQRQQLEFLLLHDRKTKRLWFIWDVEELEGKLATDRRKSKICGCVGGCSFFGNNNNGVRFFTNQALDASNDKCNHYGSESLWGGLHTDLGSNIKEHLQRRSRSGFLSTSTSIMNSTGWISGANGRKESMKSKVFSSNTDTVDNSGRSMSMVYQSRRQSSFGGNKETGSKLGFGRSRSLIDGESMKLHRLRSASSESTFYSCNSEADLTQAPEVRNREYRASQINNTSRSSKISLKSNCSTDSYVSAVSSSNLIGEDEIDGRQEINRKPLVDPSLISAYTNYMQPVTCINWRQNVPGTRNKFSLLKNLKVICPMGHRCAQPSIPNFNPNLYGKSPFSIKTSSHNLTAEEPDSSESSKSKDVGDKNKSKEEDGDTKNVITIKFHQQVSIVATPLVLKVLERFTDSLAPFSKCCHLCHLLDSLHGKCISFSKQKYREQTVTAILSKQLEAPSIEKELCDEKTLPDRNAVSILLPEIKLHFFQVSGERYIPSEQSSLSAKCGSEYSYDIDVKNTNTALLAVLVKNANIKAFVNNADPALFRCSAKILHKHDETKSAVPRHVIQKIHNLNVSKLTVVSGNVHSIKMQLLHLEGASNKERRLTAIPRHETKIDFTVYPGGNLFADSVSGGLDSAKSDDIFGEIIFEAGVEEISMSARFMSTLNMNAATDKGDSRGKDNTDNEKKQSVSRTSQTRASSVKTASEHTVHHEGTIRADSSETAVGVGSQHSVQKDIGEDEEGLDRKDNSVLSRPAWKRSNYLPLGNSTSTISSNGSFVFKSSTRKGYVALDIDSGDVADQSDADGGEVESEEENEQVSVLSSSDHHHSNKGSFTGVRQAVRYRKRGSKRQSSTKDLPSVKSHVVVNNATGGVKINNVWINLAAPTHLQLCNNETEQDVNLVMVLVPALSCWITPAYELLTSIELLSSQIRQWKYSVLAAMMGQALPDNGKLLKKNVISAAVTNLAHFLQEECSSQLINVLRRQTAVNHRLTNLQHSLGSAFVPSQDLLEKGILALARQWKTVIVGAEGVENIFATSYQQPKKPVVGRGDLPPDAVEFLLKEARESYSRIHSYDAETGSVKSNMNNGGAYSMENVKRTHSEADVLLTSSSDESADDQPKAKVKAEQTLYDWMSKSPASASVAHSPSKERRTYAAVDRKGITAISNEKDDRSINLHMLRSEMPMVSLPTSGMQLADAADVFSAILASIGLQEMDVDIKFLTKTLIQATGCVESIDITLHTSGNHPTKTSQSNKSKKDHSEPSFTLDRLSVLLNGTEKPSIVNDQKMVSTDVLFSVNVEDVHQKVNFALVRLILQVHETLEVIKEEDKFATKSKDDKTNRFEWNINKIPMSSPEIIRSKSWKNMYNVMTLYTMDSEISSKSKQSVLTSPTSSRSKLQYIRAGKTLLSVREDNLSDSGTSAPLLKESTTLTALLANNDQCKQQNESESVQKSLSITGTACLKKAKVIASISGLRLLFELKNLNGSFNRNKQTQLDLNAKKPDFKNSAVVSVHLDRLKINLIESVKALRKRTPTTTTQTTLPTDHRIAERTLLTCKVYRSHALHTNFEKVHNEKGDHYSLLAIGPIAVDIPQHPGSLRSIVTQFSKRLQKHFLEFDDYRMSRKDKPQSPPYSASVDIASMKDSLASISSTASFRITSNSIVMSAALLPSLRVEYKIEHIHAWGNLSSKARFFCNLPYHVLSFNTRVHVVPLPMTTHIDLPPIKVEGYYLEIHNDGTSEFGGATMPHSSARDHHGFLGVSINVGNLEQNLTTDLLNHMIFFQKGFAKEINEVVEVVETTEQVPLRRRPKSAGGDLGSTDGQNVVPVIYSIKVKLQGIQITATTPSSTGIRFKTGELTMEITNQNPSSSVLSLPHFPVKVYGQAQVDINIALGHFSKSSFLSNENEFTVYANFETSLGVSNILKEKRETLDKETILVSLIRPHLFVMPAAADKGVLVYLHYKNAYENWMEQRTILKSEFPAVAEHILNKIPQQPAVELSSYLILQVNVKGLGVCLPLKESLVPTGGLNTSGHQSFADTEPGPALLVTVAEASVMCCSSGSFVSTGQFTKFCLRLSDNFDHMKEKWSIGEADFMNTYTIPEGSYELCSRTIMPESQDDLQPGKWVMSLFWKMRDGVDIHIDTNIGKRLKLLTSALTALTGESDVADMLSVIEDFETLEKEEVEEGEGEGEGDGEEEANTMKNNDGADYKVIIDVVDGSGVAGVKANLPPLKKSTSFIERNTREKQLVIQTKKVNQLRRNDAHPDVISREVKQLQEIENALSKEFFKDVKKRFQRRTRRSTMDPNNRRKLNNPGRSSSQIFLDPTDQIRATSTSASMHKRPPIAVRTELENSVEMDALDITDGPLDSGSHVMGSDDVTIDSVPTATLLSGATTRLPGQVKFSGVPMDDAFSEVSSTSKTTQGLSAAALDFEFNMVVDIKSGKCTLHSQAASNNENPRDDLSKSVSTTARKQSDQTDIQRPTIHRPLRPVRSTTGNFASNLSSGSLTPQPHDYTVLLIPGVKVRLYYLSKVTLACDSTAKNSGIDVRDTSSTTNKPFLNKSATLNTSIGIQSLSKEMIVTPSILDFLERAFEPMIINTTVDSGSQSAIDDESVIGTGSMLSSSGSALYSFPVDVVVLIRVQPSDIRFNCSPISKVECLLRIPSLDFAITSTPPDTGYRKRANSKRSSTTTSNLSTCSNTEVSETTSGMGFTVCLSRFSFCVFHPYGKQYGNTVDSRSSTGLFSEQRRNSRSRNQPISGRKDSLSLNVEFIKFNLSRKIVKSMDDQKTSVNISALCDIGSAAFSYDMRRLTEILDVPKAWYKGSLMQRLFLGREGAYATKTSMNQPNKTPTSTQFSKPTTDQNNSTIDATQKTVPTKNHPIKPSSTLDPKPPAMTHRRGVSSGTSFLSNLITSPFPGTMSTSRNDNTHSYDIKPRERSRSLGDSSGSLSDDQLDQVDGPSTANFNSVSEFETKVVVAFNVTRVEVSTNLGNIMGQAIWSTNDLRTNASVQLNNIGVSTASIDVAVRQGSIDAHGGVVGGYVELHDILAGGKFIENFGETPLHSATVSMRNGEVRLDYMGSSILMSSLSSFYCKFEDHWLIPEHFTEQKQNSPKSTFSSPYSSTGTLKSSPRENPEFKSCEIYLNCDARWDELQIIISRSTATDFVKMMIKLQDFFDQQHRSGVRALNTLYHSHQHHSHSHQGGETSKLFFPTTPTVRLDEDSNTAEDKPVLKYQHWVELMNALYGLQLNNFPARIPDKNVVLGGRLSLCGNYASLACFHGTNFRTQNWGLFTIREPALQFTSETRVVEKSCQVMRAACVHDVTFSLGKSDRHKITERRKSTVNMYDFMATVRKVSRGRRNPPALGAAVQEWLVFVNTTSGDDMPFKSTSDTQDEVTERFSHTKGSGGSRKVSFAPKFRYENESAVVFALPRMRIQLTTEHDQPMTADVSKTFLRHVKDKSHVRIPLVPSPHLVDMSFLSTFEDSIHVTMDVSLLLYLHDLILSYMKEQESSVTVSTTRLNRLSQAYETTDASESSTIATKSTESAIKKEERYREFRVKNWKLDPRISLLSWVGKRMDPVSIDWVLERLGFTHAKMTIPKWIQRGVLDPMDYTLAVVMGHLLVNMKVHDAVD